MTTGCTVSLCIGHMVVRPGPLKDCYISQLIPPPPPTQKCKQEVRKMVLQAVPEDTREYEPANN